MATEFQLVADCLDRARLARFWTAALHYGIMLADPEGNEFCVV